MPEGDTIHKVAALLRPRLRGATLQAGRLRDLPAAALGGRRIEDVYARGKHLFVAFDGGLLLRSHLGLHGSWHRYAPTEPWRRPRRQACIELELEADVFVCFNAKEVELVREGSVRERHWMSRLGPDLLDPSVDLDAVARRARQLLDTSALVVDLLLDQRVAGGIGNVYKSEILFLEGMSPHRRLAGLKDGEIAPLYARAATLLARNLGAGPRVTRFERDGAGAVWVYRRGGLPCLRCGRPIQWARLGRGWRSTYWCSRCQR